MQIVEPLISNKFNFDDFKGLRRGWGFCPYLHYTDILGHVNKAMPF